MELKQDVMDEVNTHLGLPLCKVSTGSTEPREFFHRIVELLAIPTPHRTDKPGLAQAIVEAAGFPWLPDYESRGGTVTRKGLDAVREAVMLFIPD
jgi:hypothetical protein